MFRHFPHSKCHCCISCGKGGKPENHNSFIKHCSTWLKARVVVETGSSFFFLDSDLRIAVHYYELRASSGWLEYLAVSILLLFGTLLLMITHADPNDICQG